jgi:beta-glucanase (GH16 family)
MLEEKARILTVRQQKTIHLTSCRVLFIVVSLCALILGTFLALAPSRTIPKAHATTDNASWNEIWDDEFNGLAGSPVDSQWQYDLGTGWGNNQQETDTNSTTNIYEDGNSHLVIKPVESNGSWTSGRIETVADNFAAPVGGEMEVTALIQLPDVTGAAAQGYWPAFWMLGAGLRNGGTWPSVGEIDAMESVNGTNVEYGTLHCGTNSGGPCNETYGLGGNTPCAVTTCQAGYHTYTVVVDRTTSPEEIRWYLDGTEFWHVASNNPGMDPTTWANAVDHGFFIILNVAMGGYWPGYPTSSTQSGAGMSVDYVRVYTANGSTGGNPPPTPTPTATPPSGTLVTAIDAGGSASGNFVADTDFNQGNEFSDTSTSINTSGVAESIPQAVWQTCRWNASFAYTIPGLTAGTTYTVDLDWAELTWQAAGGRVFNVAINGTAVLNNFDVYALVGYKTALQKQFSVVANSSGQIVISFTKGSADNPFISGIEIYQRGGSGTPTPTPTTAPTATPTTAPTATPTTAPTPTPTATPPSGTLVTAIDAGGSASGNFVADTDFNQGNEFSDTSTSINTSGVSNPAPQAVWQTCRWNSAFAYTIPGLNAGNTYTLDLDWAELSWQAAGKREFNVAINGSQVLTNFDVYANAGYKTALQKQFSVVANSSGQIVISFTQGSADNPFLSGIEIYKPNGSGTPTPTPTTAPTATPTTAPTATPTTAPTATPTVSPSLVTAIDAGGSATGNFSSDIDYNTGNEFSDTSTSINTSGVSNPAPQAVWQTCRWNSAFTYTLTGLTAGASYTLDLDWAELTWTAAGEREFNVAINGSQVLTNFDVYANAGYKTALQRQFTVTANSSGQVVISFTQGATDNPFLSGIQLYIA